MILIVGAEPYVYQQLTKRGPLEMNVNLQNTISGVSELAYVSYQQHCAHGFMMGYIYALKSIACMGDVSVHAAKGKHSVTGTVYVWHRSVALAIDELGDVLEAAAKRFTENHPKASSIISATFAPAAMANIQHGTPPLQQ